MRSLEGKDSVSLKAAFSFLELLIVVAIIAILVVIVAPTLIDEFCRRNVEKARAAIKVCEIAIAQSNVQNTTNCLAAASAAIKQFQANEACFKNLRPLLVKAADEINAKIENFKLQSEVSDADKQTLENAKIVIPP